jgi:hypothetical protein
MAARNQITMDETLRRRASQRAAELGLSFAEYVRRVIADDLGEMRRKGNIAAVFDLVTDGPVTDIAREKDAILADAVRLEQRRKTTARATASRRNRSKR